MCKGRGVERGKNLKDEQEEKKQMSSKEGINMQDPTIREVWHALSASKTQVRLHVRLCGRQGARHGMM